jgi:molybdopterin-guanine dinucleotide biosynthesis protein B
MITSGQRWVLMHELRGEPEPDMASQLERFSPCDLILVEGYKRAAIPKIEVYRPATGHSLIHPEDADIVAVAADGPVHTTLPVLDLNDYDAVAAFIVQHVGLTGHRPSP